MVAAEIGRHCGATALSYNMHVCSTHVGRLHRRRAGHDARAARRPRRQPRAALRQHRRTRPGLFAALLRRRRRGRRQGALRHAGAGRWTAATSSAARRSSPRWPARPTSTACCARWTGPARRSAIRCTWRCRPMPPACSVVGDWDPLGMRGTVSRTLLLQDVFVPHTARLMPEGLYFQAAGALPAHVRHAVAHLHGHRAGGLRLHGGLPARRGARHAAGEAPHVPDQAVSRWPRCA